jgi:hypothetical protein
MINSNRKKLHIGENIDIWNVTNKIVTCNSEIPQNDAFSDAISI